MRGRWEYRHIALSFIGSDVESAILRALNELGGDGWELVSVAASGTDSQKHHAYFKRTIAAPIPEGFERRPILDKFANSINQQSKNWPR